jgi:hypothetical protein
MQSLEASKIQILLATLEYETTNIIAFSHLLTEMYCNNPSSLDKTRTNNKETKEDKTEDTPPLMPPNQ